MINPKAHYMKPGAVAFIPGWILLFITILTWAIFFPGFFSNSHLDKPYIQIISPLLLSFLIGSLMPAFDDLFAYLFGPPFAHHSLFHSFFGSLITFLFFYLISTPDIAMYAFLGNLYHICFNAILDYVTLFFPLSYREFGLTDLVGFSTYQIKILFYPLILILFGLAVLIGLIR